MKTEYTPGPWNTSRVSFPSNSPDFSVYAGNSHHDIARIMNDNGAANARLIAAANARLIAAAPDLLAALDRCNSYLADLNGCEWIKGNDAGAADMRQRAKALQSIAWAAIAKATGESA